MGCICSGTETVSKQKKGVQPDDLNKKIPIENERDGNTNNNIVHRNNNQQISNNAQHQREEVNNSSSFSMQENDHNVIENININQINEENENNDDNDDNLRPETQVAQSQTRVFNNVNSNLNNNQNIIPHNTLNIGPQSRHSSNYSNVLAQPNYEPFLQSKNDPSFNMLEINDLYVGHDLKKMKGYICNIEKEELDKRREDFWTSREEGCTEIWNLLKYYCSTEFNPKELKELLHSSGISPYAGSISVVYDTKGNLYEIPNYCIHDPSKWDIAKLKVVMPKEEKIILRIRKVVKDYNISISNLSNIISLKEGLIKNFFQDNTVDKLRLFYNGKELKDKDNIYMYEIPSKSILQLMIRE